MNDPIDIVIPWVDGSDAEWQKEKTAYQKQESPEENSVSDIRFESWDNLRYWFRAVEKFMPWVHKIFFVTWGHLPEFLNTEHPKLEIIKHGDYIPSEYLPTFNSNTIEMNCHRIKNLSENFILFNDDIILLRPIEEEYYLKENKVCDEAVENIIVTAQFGPVANMARYTQVNNMMIINKHFQKREVQKRDYEKWFLTDYGELNERTESLRYWNNFPGFHDPHMPNAMKKSVLKRIWETEPEALHKASQNHFRAYSDVTQYLVRYWQLCEGDFYARRTEGKVCYVTLQNCKEIAEGIRNREWRMICMNEDCTPEEFAMVKEEINSALETILPEKSAFEKQIKVG